MITEQELKICNLMGVNPNDYIATKEENLYLNSSLPDSVDHWQKAKIKEAEQAVMKLMGITPEELNKLQAQSAACSLTAEEIEICRQLGVIPVDYLAGKMKDAGITKHPSGRMEVK